MSKSKKEYVYIAPRMTIGNHEWRIVVKKFWLQMPGEKTQYVTQYQWRKFTDLLWRPADEWPSYDINNGMTLGLPKTVSVLYEKYEIPLQYALENGEAMPADLALKQEGNGQLNLLLQ